MKRIALTLLSTLFFAFQGLAGGLPANLQLNTVFTSDTSDPLAVRHAGDGSGRLFIMH